MPQLLALNPRGVLVDETGRYQGLAPWLESRLLAEVLRRYNEYQPFADFVDAWARLPADAHATVDDARREAALALSKARSLSGLVSGHEPEPPATRGFHPARRMGDWRREPAEPRPPGKEPPEPN